MINLTEHEMKDMVEDKCLEYRNYILYHIKCVKKAFDDYGERLCNKLHVDIDFMKPIIDCHDQSKFEQIEFSAYRSYFYPAEFETRDEQDIVNGFLLHENRNPHHPEFWVYRDDKNIVYQDMPKHYIIEMLCDWQSFAYTFNKEEREAIRKDTDDSAMKFWYEKARDTKPLTEKSINIIDNVICVFDR